MSFILPWSRKPTSKALEASVQRATDEDLATTYSALHLLNPMVFSISTRGSSESVLCLFVLLTLYASLAERWNLAAIMLGVSTHWKIYPAIYGFSCLGVVGGAAQCRGCTDYFSKIVNMRTVRFGMISVSTFFALGAGCYLV